MERGLAVNNLDDFLCVLAVALKNENVWELLDTDRFSVMVDITVDGSEKDDFFDKNEVIFFHNMQNLYEKIYKIYAPNFKLQSLIKYHVQSFLCNSVQYTFLITKPLLEVIQYIESNIDKTVCLTCMVLPFIGQYAYGHRFENLSQYIEKIYSLDNTPKQLLELSANGMKKDFQKFLSQCVDFEYENGRKLFSPVINYLRTLNRNNNIKIDVIESQASCLMYLGFLHHYKMKFNNTKISRYEKIKSFFETTLENGKRSHQNTT